MQSKCVTTDLMKDNRHSPKIKLQLLMAVPEVIQQLAKSAKPVLLLFSLSLQPEPGCLCSIYDVN